jgi:5-methylcytosine-specific restriction protein B
MNTFKEFLEKNHVDEHIVASLETVAFTNKNGKKFAYPLEDLRKCLQALWIFGDRVRELLKDDWTYEEAKFRQAFNAAFVKETSNAVASNLGSQTPNTVRCLELYAYFLLNEAPSSKLETPDILKGSSLDALFYGDDLSGEYRDWLRGAKQLSDKSVDSYTGAVSGLLSKCAGKNLFRLSSPEIFVALREVVVAHEDFVKHNNTGNQMYSAALNHYSAFLAQRAGMELQEAFRAVCTFCRVYNTASDPWMRNDPRCLPVQQALKTIQEWAQSQFGQFGGIPFEVDIAKGSTNFPKVPWVCLLPPNQSANDGVFVSICFGREGNGAVAGFAESVSNRKGLNVVKRTANAPLVIDVDGASPGTKYNDSFENPREFRPDDFDEDKFKAHIDTSLRRCRDFLGLQAKEPFGPTHKDAFRTGLDKAGFSVIDSLPENFVTALATKPFIILTGNSGTGKTKLAEMFAQWLCGEEQKRLALVPVGADWTDNRNVLGFVNHIRTTKPLGETEGGVPLYQSTRILDLLLAAGEQPSKPFFLILDEMNLSHVERYFADFLSAMESRKGELILHREGRLLPRELGGKADVPEILELPRNVFIIGTVNVDETTYMFSPKVLDRANVIEFRVDEDAPKKFLASGAKPIAPINAAPAGYSAAFLTLSFRARGLNGSSSLALASDPASLPEEAKKALEKCRTTVSEVFEIMQKSHLEFAFRSMSEILRFLAVDYELTANKPDWKWKLAMDSQILQKILPKLHGSKRKLGALLAALASYCEQINISDAEKSLLNQTAVETYVAEGKKVFLTPVFKESHRKLCEMIVAVRRDQFVSFIQ